MAVVQQFVTFLALKRSGDPAEAVAGYMVGTAENAGLRRKAQIARQGHEARDLSPVRALRLASEKAADEDLSLILNVRSIDRLLVDHARLVALVPEGALLVLLDGPDGSAGAIMLDAATLGAVIEMQTMGQVQPRPPRDRPLTRTDAAMAAPLVDGILRRLSQSLADHPDSYWTCGFHFGAMIEDRRSLGLALTGTDYHLFRMQLYLGPVLREGEVMLALPQCADPDQPRQDAELVVASERLQQRLLSAPVRLEAVLCRLSLPLSELGKLAVGDVLHVPPDVLRTVSLDAGGQRGVATGRLGQMDGMRALRLNLAGAVADQAVLPATGAQETNQAPPQVAHPMTHADRTRLDHGAAGGPQGIPSEQDITTSDPDRLAGQPALAVLPQGLDGAYDDAAFALDDGPVVR
jgi:flagellar motor switch protein FliM